MSRYELIGYCSYRDNETGFVADDFVNVLNKQDEEIKELEKIIKSNSNNKWIKAQYELFKKDCSSLNAHLDQLKYQLTEKDCELQKLKSQIEEQKNINKKLNLENQKLFEENISQSYDVEKCVKVAKEQIVKTFNAECELSIVKTNQNQLAIEELEKLKNNISNTHNNHWFLAVEADVARDIIKLIDQRINELRGEK